MAETRVARPGIMKRIALRFLNWLVQDARFDRIRILPEVIEDICAMARGSSPKEMVAFLTGEIRKQGREHILLITGLYVKSYAASERSTSFTTHDLPPLHVYGTVHSHPSTDNHPSAADRRLFSSHGWFHLIVCKPFTRDRIAVYNKYGEPIQIEF
jgi:proteasome lid subunit RPN8/RPN11